MRVCLELDSIAVGTVSTWLEWKRRTTPASLLDSLGCAEAVRALLATELDSEIRRMRQELEAHGIKDSRSLQEAVVKASKRRDL